MKPDLVICFGNELLSDDGFGPKMARLLTEASTAAVDVLHVPVMSFALLDVLAGRERVLIIDTVQSGHCLPGALLHLTLAALDQSDPLRHSHWVALPSLLDLGRRLGLPMPSSVEFLCVEALDVGTLRQELSAAVQAALPAAADAARRWMVRTEQWCPECS